MPNVTLEPAEEGGHFDVYVDSKKVGHLQPSSWEFNVEYGSEELSESIVKLLRSDTYPHYSDLVTILQDFVNPEPARAGASCSVALSLT